MEALLEIARKQERLVVGMMSGTSSDGVDAALVRISGSRLNTKVEPLAFKTLPYPSEFQQRILSLQPPNSIPAGEISRLGQEGAELYAQAVLEVVMSAGLMVDDVDLISMQGFGVYGVGEIVDSAVVMERTGITTIVDLRRQDVAVGGQGAPMSGYVDWVLFREEHIGRAIQNIGGIANVSGIPPGAELDDIITFDTGPGNMIIDALARIFTNGAQSFDRDGAVAAQGQVNQTLLSELMDHPFIKRPPPKAAGFKQFGQQFTRQLIQVVEERGISHQDLMATATAYTAEAIASSYERFLMSRFRIDEVILGGGGVHNLTMVRMLRERLTPTPVYTHEDYGINSDAREAISWAVLGNETIQGYTANVPTVTGASRRVLLGKILPGHRCIVD